MHYKQVPGPDSNSRSVELVGTFFLASPTGPGFRLALPPLCRYADRGVYCIVVIGFLYI